MPLGIVLGDLAGLLALFLMGASASFMLLRTKILKITKNLNLIRSVHILISVFAGASLLVHVLSYLQVPANSGIYLGYVSFALAILVWITGTAFVEKLRESFFFHSALSIAVIALAIIHGMISGVNFPLQIAATTILGVIVIAFINMGYQLIKIGEGTSKKKAPQITRTANPNGQKRVS